ncbi:MinD superfamily P-loop ATPase, contains an inserted ferredoxin domain [Saccharicrinis carchari]|uniref:MinD superfamily P-loop ATPase, contains an inserted ferredoxin domain n=1 Tax=Saccharicrinis carchari TaxID=1168039 RepID=A0A521AJ13_SACCC|nr:ATP-binding protein [Saccharicrinis carchari]SMO34835.1 MinD superfamily P-loop ATPase, contains an inserted ferredoxin domain [Saccharicrinis carchari]
MSCKIAVASGKGGTGKTTVAVSIYHMLAQTSKGKVQLVDCDVEEPNDLIFFDDAEEAGAEDVLQMIPAIDTEKCTFCRKCAEYCEFNAIVVLPTAQFAEINSSLCHSCGACLVACPSNAITEHPHPIGKISHYKTKVGEGLLEGKLNIGSAMQTMLIRELKKKVAPNREIVIYDGPPGTSCSAVETTIDADYVLLVTEPTPFGLHDLKITVELMKQLNKAFGIIINKAGLGNEDIYHYIRQNNLELLGEIPFANSFASNYAQGKLLETLPPEITKSLKNVLNRLQAKILSHEGNNLT